MSNLDLVQMFEAHLIADGYHPAEAYEQAVAIARRVAADVRPVEVIWSPLLNADR